MPFNQSVNRAIFSTFMVIYLSYIIFFDLRILSARLGISTPDLGHLLFLWGVLLAPFCLYFCTFIKYRQTQILCLIFSTYVAFGVLVGIANGNAIEDLSGDLLKALFIPAGIGIYFLFKADRDFVEKVLYNIGSAFVCLRTLLFIGAFGSVTSLYFGTKMDALLICLGLKKLTQRRTGQSWGASRRVGNLLIVVASLIGQKRALLIPLAVYLCHNNKRLLFLASLVAVSLILYLDSFEWRGMPFIGRFLSLTDIHFMLQNQAMRIAEVTTAFSAWTSGAGSFALGHGFGAEILVFTGRENYAEALHSLHNTPVAVLYRSGVVGLCLLVYLILVAVRGILRGRSSDGAIILALFMTSFFIYSFIDEVFIGYYAARILDTSVRQYRARL